MCTSWTRIGLTNVLWILGVLAQTASAQVARSINNNVIDARDWDFARRLPLSGGWTFVENKILGPEAIRQQSAKIITFHTLWNDIRPGGRGTGCATYALTVLVPSGVERWSFEIPPLYNSYNLWVNNKLIAFAGVVGENIEETKPQWISQVAEYTELTDTLTVVLQVANYHHYKGGASSPIYLGLPRAIKSHFNWAMGSSIAEGIVLFSGGIAFMLFYSHCRKKVILYFSLLCLTCSIRAIFSNMYPQALIFPSMDWESVVKVEYITLYLAVIWAALFFKTLFNESSNPVFTYLPVAVNIFFIVFTLVTPAIIFTRWITIYLSVAVLVIFYGLTMVVRALIIEKVGSGFLMASIWTGTMLFAYDIAAYHLSFSYNLVLMNTGYVLIFSLTTIGLLYHLGIFKNKNERPDFLTMEDMYHR